MTISIAQVLIVFASIEEAREGNLACRVVRVHVVVDFGHKRLLDIPESVLGHSADHLHVGASLRSMSESILQVLDGVVFIATLDGSKFFIKDLIPLVSDGGVLTELVVESHAEGADVPVLLRKRLVFVSTLEFATHDIFIKSILEVLISNGKDQSAVLVAAGAGERLEHALHDRAALIATRLELGGIGLRSGLLVSLQFLHVLEEMLIFLFRESIQFRSLISVVSNENVLH